MKRLILTALFMAATPSFACINDRDTLAQEAAAQKADSSGLPNVARVITGRFERNPPLYYEMRLERVAKELKANPTKLDLYDDAGAASDRLHRSKEAIEWMERKRKQLEISKIDSKSKREHLYRYFANAGTFHAHLWLRSGANRKDMREMKLGRDMIKKAIEIKPNAHFGREKYQLLLMEWILNPSNPAVTTGVSRDCDERSTRKQPAQNSINPSYNDFLNLIDLKSYDGEDLLKTSNYPDAIRGLSGLVVLGDAWSSFDVFYALSQALNAKGDTAIAELARQRSLELLNDGRSSLSPNLKIKISEDFQPSFARVHESPAIHELYSRLRAEAVSYQYLRESYMNTLLRDGSHPDTNPNFWKGWKEPPLPSLEVPNQAEEDRKATFKSIKQIGGFLLVGVLALCTGIRIGWRRSSAHALSGE